MHDYDVIVIGSGFGGSVSALRLTEKGYRVGVLEAGRRFTDDELPKTSWELRKFLWAPRLGLYGMQRIHLLKHVLILAGAGVGGGSLVYANTLYEPMQPFFDDPQWSHVTDWRAELAPHYERAKRMLGVVTNPTMTNSDTAMRQVADEMGRGHTFRLTPVGVFFGRDGKKEPGVEVPDPYFGGAGPARRGCLECGECMIGCRHGAKNRLDKNYLYLAERAGAMIHPLTTVSAVRPVANGYAVETYRTGRPTKTGTFTAEHVIFAAGAWGTAQLLQKLRADGTLPNISGHLGRLTRTNSEALLGATTPKVKTDYSEGVAITSSWYPDEVTHIEPVRYGKGSNSMGLLSTVLVDGGGRAPRWLKVLGEVARRPWRLPMLLPKRWSERTVIALVMQPLNNSITVRWKKTLFGKGKLTSQQGEGDPNPTWIPVGHEAVRRLANNIGGQPGCSVAQVFNVPMTAHFIGGCPIGETPEEGVVDPYQRLFGYEGLHVVDGSALTANLGVNPSLTITAQAERAMAFWPNKGEPDMRPALGRPYQRLTAVAARRPVVAVKTSLAETS